MRGYDSPFDLSFCIRLMLTRLYELEFMKAVDCRKSVEQLFLEVEPMICKRKIFFFYTSSNSQVDQDNKDMKVTRNRSGRWCEACRTH